VNGRALCCALIGRQKQEVFMYTWQQHEIKIIRSLTVPTSTIKLEDTAAIAKIFQQHADEADQESFWVLAFDSEKHLIGVQELHRGNSWSVMVHHPLVFRFPIVLNAYGFVVVHNHPSGPAEASNADLAFTSDLYRIATDLGLDFHDSLIVGVGGQYSSLRASLRKTTDPIWHDHVFKGTCLELGELCKVRPTELAESA
jgi:DNA repair protein RadC